MKNFSDLNIQQQANKFIGDKIGIHEIINEPITVHKFEIKPSKYTGKGNGKCLSIQITMSDNKQRVIFTGSGALMETLEKISKSDFPFTTKIIKDNKRFEFR